MAGTVVGLNTARSLASPTMALAKAKFILSERLNIKLVDPHGYIYTTDGDGRDKTAWRKGTTMTTTDHSMKYTHT